jgi:Uma2 family endonuclease
MNPAPSYGHQRIGQQLAVILDPLARAAGLEAVVGGVNIGTEEDYRIPDASLHERGTRGIYLPSAAVAVEILSPGDESWEKLPFYAAHGVAELVLVDPEQRKVQWLGIGADGSYQPVDRSSLIELSASELGARLEWA